MVSLLQFSVRDGEHMRLPQGLRYQGQVLSLFLVLVPGPLGLIRYSCRTSACPGPGGPDHDRNGRYHGRRRKCW